MLTKKEKVIVSVMCILSFMMGAVVSNIVSEIPSVQFPAETTVYECAQIAVMSYLKEGGKLTPWSQTIMGKGTIMSKLNFTIRLNSVIQGNATWQYGDYYLSPLYACSGDNIEVFINDDLGRPMLGHFATIGGSPLVHQMVIGKDRPQNLVWMFNFCMCADDTGTFC